MSEITRIEALEVRIAEHQQALNVAIEKRDNIFLGTTMELLLGALAIFVFIEAAQTSELWLKMFGWNVVIAVLASVVIGLGAAFGVIWLLRGLSVRITSQAMQKLPGLPDWQKSEFND